MSPIAGANFTGATAVKFNTTAATSFTVASANKITATVAAGTTTGLVYVTTPKGTANSGSRQFTVAAGAASPITSFTPASGAAGTEVLINGTNFTSANGVKFNGINVAAADILSVTATQIKAKVPSGASTGPISVINAANVTTDSSTSFIVPPIISSFSPTVGGVGQAVTISGSNFVGVTRVDFNGMPANFVVNSPTGIYTTVPDGASTGLIKLTVSGNIATTSSTSFTINSPNVTSFVPTSGSTTTLVTLNGTNFTASTKVKFNGIDVPAANVKLLSDKKLTANVPTGASTGPISVMNSTTWVNSASNFQVVPSITSFTPAKGEVGVKVVLTGNSFENVTDVTFNGISTYFVIISPTTIWAIVPGNVTTGRIKVSTPDGSYESKTDFIAAPKISSFSPGGSESGEIVTINGTNLGNVTAVQFNGISAGSKVANINSASSGFQIINEQRIDVRVPSAATTGPISVLNTTGAPTLTAISSSDFIVAPQISNFDPVSGAVGAKVKLTGTNFAGANSVIFLGDISTVADDRRAVFTIVSSTQIETTVPTNAVSGPIAVTSSFGGNPSSTSFIVAPRITSFTPTSGAAGTSVVISGANFSGTTEVKFNVIVASDFQVNTAGNQITVKVPSGSATGKISVKTPIGLATSTGDFTASAASLKSASSSKTSVGSS